MIRRILLGLLFIFGGVYLFVEIAADIGGVLWLKHWLADEGVDEQVAFRSGRADPVLRNGVVYGVKWTPDFVSEPVSTDQILVKRTSDDVFDFERSRWDFDGDDIDLHLKDSAGKVNVGRLAVGVSDYEGFVEFEMEEVVATADGLDAPLRVGKVTGSFDTVYSPPQYIRLKMEGVRLPEVAEEGSGGDFQGIPLGELQEELGLLGYEDAEFDLELSAFYDRKSKTFEIDELLIEGAGLAKITLILSLKDVSRKIKIRGIGDLMSEATVVKIVGARLEVEDYGLVRRAMEQRAGEKGMEVGEAAVEIAKRWPIGASEKQSAISFLNNPDSIVIELLPRSPAKLFDLVALRETEAILRRLGFRVTNSSEG